MQLAKENRKFQYKVVRRGGNASMFHYSICGTSKRIVQAAGTYQLGGVQGGRHLSAPPPGVELHAPPVVGNGLSVSRRQVTQP